MAAHYVDWRSPGEKWIKTDFGWRKWTEVTSSLHQQLCRNSHNSSMSSSATSSRRVSGNSTPMAAAENIQTQDADKNQPEPSIPCIVDYTGVREIQRIDKKITNLHMLLDKRCVSARSSSKESSNYSTIADAIAKLNFEAALNDNNYFTYICKIVSIIFTTNKETLSGTVQNSLLRMMDKAKEISIETTCYSGAVLNMMDSALLAYEKERVKWKSGYALRNINTKIRSILRMKKQLKDHLNVEQLPTGFVGILDLPNECIRMIAEYLTNPRDLLNFGTANWHIHQVSEENVLWKRLMQYQYNTGEVQLEAMQLDWKSHFITQYRIHGGELREGNSCVACFCPICNYVFWKSYGHPCLQTNGNDTFSSVHHQLSPQLFTSYFYF